ncbi:MAG TPA: lactate utilization protein B [Saprospiraceae bacterium]|nr:lactate utilization protein B [Saprospiraceae bacterium]
MKTEYIRHPEASVKFIENDNKAIWHDQTLWFIRKKRDDASVELPEWEDLRELASDIKDRVLAKWDQLLIRFEKEAIQNGAHVHWARNAREHNEIIAGILLKKQIDKVVKSKSMLTEECELNPYLESKSIEVIDTDLGERIIQLRNEQPSHIVAPAIHLKKEEVSDLFHYQFQSEKGNADPVYLMGVAREHLREKFLQARAAITGVNFAIAENGVIVVCTNEGNADYGVHTAEVVIHCMGIEKIIPAMQDLGIFIRLLARSATGQPITIYTSHFKKPPEGQEMHIVMVDNGRIDHLGKENFRSALKCIRCGACLNTCPVYRRSGGYSYHSTIPGPIGSILTPGKDLEKYADLPFASTLCGSCSDVCPVKIDIHHQLYKWRQMIVQNGLVSKSKKWQMNFAGWIMRHPSRFQIFLYWCQYLLRNLPRFLLNNRWNRWIKHREMPVAPNGSFSDWYKQNRM